MKLLRNIKIVLILDTMIVELFMHFKSIKNISWLLPVFVGFTFFSLSGLGDLHDELKAGRKQIVGGTFMHPIVETSLGFSCKLDTDCAGWGWKVPNSCCSGICTATARDWAGVPNCPNICVGYAGGPHGSCKTAEEHGDCKSDAQCKVGACCDGKCELKRKDWIGEFFCPNVCVGDILKGAGSCAAASLKRKASN